MESIGSSSYKQIVKSTSIFGGSQLINIFIGVIRNKIIAILLGAAGVGLIGIYQSVVDLVRSISGFGMEMTGVKEIASSNDDIHSKNLSLTVYIVRRLIQFTALCGALICLILCYPISIWAFGDTSHAIYIAALSLVVFLSTLLQGQLIVLQGLRQIATMAKVLLIGNIASLVLTLPFLYFFGISGILPTFIIGSGIYYLLSVKYYSPVAKRFTELHEKPHLKLVFGRGKSMFRLGIYLVGATILNTLTMFAIRIFISDKLGVESAGLFQSVWAITNVYLMLILKSMGNDFYPRLCALAEQRVAFVRLINQQTFVAIVVSTPIIVGMLLFGTFVLTFLYSSKFLLAESLLRWQILGTFFKVLSWPMAFILLAKNRGKQYIFSELLFFVVYYGINYLLFPYFGLHAAGIAYLIAYLFYLSVIFLFAIQLIRFNWSKQVWMSSIVSLLFILLSFWMVQTMTGFMFYILGAFLFLISCVFSIWKFSQIVDIHELWNKLRRWKE